MRIASLLLLAVGLASTPRLAEARPPAKAAQSIDVLHRELTDLQKQLAETEARALQDPTLVAEAQKLDTDVRAALKKADPGFEKKIARLEQIVKEMEAKHAAKAPEGELMPLIVEGQSIQRELEATHAKVLEAAPMKRRIEAFRESVRKRMTELDPQTPKRLERMEAIVRELQGRAGKAGT